MRDTTSPIYIQPSAELIDEPDIKEKIELIGRTCYRSENKIRLGSADVFVATVMRKKHYSILEHIPIYLTVEGVPMMTSMAIFSNEYDDHRRAQHKPPIPAMQQCKLVTTNNAPLIHFATNARVIAEIFDSAIEHMAYDYMDGILSWIRDNEAKLFFKTLIHNIVLSDTFRFLAVRENVSIDDWRKISKPDPQDAPYYAGDLVVSTKSPLHPYSPAAQDFEFRTVKFRCDRGVSHEIVRHRNCAFMQESTRYCDYLERGAEFILPEVKSDEERYIIETACFIALDKYAALLDMGEKPEIARAVLPNCLATTLIVTAPLSEWNHIFGMRIHDQGGTAHPQIKEVMTEAQKLVFPIGDLTI